METDELVKIFREGGYEIKKKNSFYFYRSGAINYSFPQLNNIRTDKSLINHLKWRSLITVIKTDLPFKNVIEFILTTKDYGIETFPLRKVRNIIRKSQSECEFRKPSPEDMIEAGLKINRQTMKRHGRDDKHSTNPKLWTKFIHSIWSKEDIHILGAYSNNNMIGYIIAFKHMNGYFLCNPYYDMKYSCLAPMNGLIYTLINQILDKEGSVRISYGLESFSPNPGLDRFKTNMQFKKVYTSRLYIINPFLLPLIKTWVFFNMVVLKKRMFKSSLSRKIIKLYQGHRLLSKAARAL